MMYFVMNIIVECHIDFVRSNDHIERSPCPAIVIIKPTPWRYAPYSVQYHGMNKEFYPKVKSFFAVASAAFLLMS